MANTHPTKRKKKPLTNNTTTDRKEKRPREIGDILDPSIPLSNPKHEHFADLMSLDTYGCDAWLIAINPQCKRNSAKSQASKLRARRDVASRIVWLRANKYGKNKPKGPTGRAAPKEPNTPQNTPQDDTTQKPPEKTGLLTLTEVQEEATDAVRSSSSSTEKTAALKMALPLLKLESGEATANPQSILEYITSTAGKSHAEIAADLGGVRQMIEQVFTFAKVPVSVQRRVIGRMYRDTPKDTQAEDTQTGEHLLSDGQSDNTDDESNSDPREDVGQVGGGGKTTPPV